MKRRVWVLAVIVGSVLSGCAGSLQSVNDLKEGGYERVELAGTAVVGERRGPSNYEVWWKESRERGRVVRICMVPRVPNAGYQWGVVLSVGGQEVWRYDGGLSLDSPGRPGRSGLRTGIDCADSPSLPEGRLGVRTGFVWWQ